jgi:receptor protein-tyrosine kinase
VASSLPMAEAIKERLALPESASSIESSISATSEFGTVIIDLTVTRPDPREAQQILQALIDSYNTVLSKVDSTERKNAPIAVATMNLPTYSATPSSPKTTLNIVVGLIAGLFVGFAVAALRDAVDNSIKDPDDVAEVDLATLGQLPTARGTRSGDSVVVGSRATGGRTGPIAEAFRQLRVTTEFCFPDRAKMLLAVTSCEPGEGKSFVSANLAASYGAAGSSVLLIDLDLRRPMLAKRLGLVQNVGVTTSLIGRTSITDAIQMTSHGFDLLASGPIPPNPVELLGSPNFAAMLKDIQGKYDIIILDTPPVLPFADARQIASHVDGTILVAERGRTRSASLRDAADNIVSVGGRTIGVVINKVKRDRNAKYQDYYYYYDAAEAGQRKA